MTLSINDEQRGRFIHPQNKRNTHLRDGRINSDFYGLSYLDVQCNSNCEYKVNQVQPNYEVNAVLNFDNFEANYGFHADQ